MLKLTYNYDVIWVVLIFMAFFKKKLVRAVLPTVLSAVVGLLGNVVFSLEHSSALFTISIIGLIVSLRLLFWSMLMKPSCMICIVRGMGETF